MSIRTYHGLPAEALARPSFVTIGNFDGVHRGHQALLGDMAAAAHAAGCLAGVLTFDPHPLAILRPQVKLAFLTTVGEREALLAAHGLDFLVVLPFTREVAATSASDFMSQLADHLRLAALWVGPDFALGRGREGTPERLREIGVGLGFDVHVIDPFDDLGAPVHSSRIRALLSDDGAVAEVASLLGRPYELWGEVTSGARRGHNLGYPTANLAVPETRLVPAFGIYACWAWLGEDDPAGHPAAVSIGVRPTFDNGERSIEAYLLDYRDDIYGQRLGLSFIRRLRAELRFPNAEALIAQMGADVSQTRAILSDPPDDTGRSPADRQPWRELSHTADWAFQVYGATLRQLFARAAAAMFATEDPGVEQPIILARALRVEAGDPPALLVGWLNRLLYHQEVHGEMYSRFEIHDLSEHGLLATAYGHQGRPEHTAVKAATFGGLSLTQTAAGWEATLTFDV